MESGDPLISADCMKANANAPDVRIVDATWFAPFLKLKETGRESFARGHIPGAVFFDIDEIADTDSPFPHMLPDPVKFSARVRQLGIGDGHRIIVYDQNRFFASARVWWMFRYMGKTDVKVLDGGLAAWTKAGGELDDLPPAVSVRHFTPRVRAGLLIGTQGVQSLLKTHHAALIDARPEGRFTGKDPEPREGLPSGHIPGSVNVPGGSLITAEGFLKPADDLKTIFRDPMRDAVLTCGSGVTAAVNALALARLGNWDAAIYDGSWSEWASDPARPIAKGAA